MSSPQHEFMQFSEKQKLATVYNNKQLYKVLGESKSCVVIYGSLKLVISIQFVNG